MLFCFLVHGNWSDWEDDPAGCSVTCGGGLQLQTRTCDNPTPQHGGDPCTGTDSQNITCADWTCPRKNKTSTQAKHAGNQF